MAYCLAPIARFVYFLIVIFPPYDMIVKAGLLLWS